MRRVKLLGPDEIEGGAAGANGNALVAVERNTAVLLKGLDDSVVADRELIGDEGAAVGGGAAEHRVAAEENPHGAGGDVVFSGEDVADANRVLVGHEVE